MTRAFRLALATALALFGAGCTPELGDKCVLSTDCSLRGDRTCDTSQPGGYCTIRDCRANSCPDDGACVLYEPTVPGCGFDSRSPSRVSRSYCMAGCEEDGDCRGGYVCVDPKQSPWNAVILDTNTNKKVCILPASGGATASPSTAPAVCSPFVTDAGTIDAHSVYDATIPDDASSDAGTDADAADAGVPDAGDAGADAPADAPLG